MLTKNISKKELNSQVLQKLATTSLDAIQISDEEGTLIYINEVAAKRLGIGINDFSDYNVADFDETFDVRNGNKWQQHIAELKSKQSLIVESSNVNQENGHVFPVEVYVSYKKINDEGLIIAASRDITERHKLQLKLFKNTKSLVDHYQLVSMIHNTVNNMFIGKRDIALSESLKKIVDKYPVDRISYFVNQRSKRQFIKLIEVSSDRLEDLDAIKSSRIIKHSVIPVVYNMVKNESVLFFANGFDKENVFDKLEMDEYVKSAVIIPLKIDDEIYGFIKLDYIGKKRNFDKRLKHFFGVYQSILYSSLKVEILGQQLKRSNLIFTQISSSINDLFFLYDVSNKQFEYFSSNTKELLGVEWKVGMGLNKIETRDSLRFFVHSLEVLQKKDYTEYEFKISNNSQVKIILKKMNAIRDLSGGLIKVSGIYTDITYRKKATFELRKSLELISEKNAELEEKNNQINELIKRQEMDLYLKTAKMSNKSNLLNKVQLMIQDLSKQKSFRESAKISRIQKYLNEIIDDRSKSWEELRLEYEKIRPNFFINLNKKYPELSDNDLKHCYYQITGLNNKETASLLNVSVRSVETARYRIKKKLKLNTNDKLFSFLNEIT